MARWGSKNMTHSQTCIHTEKVKTEDTLTYGTDESLEGVVEYTNLKEQSSNEFLAGGSKNITYSLT